MGTIDEVRCRTLKNILATKTSVQDVPRTKDSGEAIDCVTVFRIPSLPLISHEERGLSRARRASKTQRLLFRFWVTTLHRYVSFHGLILHLYFQISTYVLICSDSRSLIYSLIFRAEQHVMLLNVSLVFKLVNINLPIRSEDCKSFLRAIYSQAMCK